MSEILNVSHIVKESAEPGEQRTRRAFLVAAGAAGLAYTAALAYTGEDDLSDPAGALPTVWFQWSGTQEPRQRWHLDVWVDPDEVQPRIDAALAAGGRLVDDSHAPSFWVLADAQGNRLCLCTWQER